MDKWLWAVRLYKTRALAMQACRGGHVTIEGQPVKASRPVRVNDVVAARTGEMVRTLRVTAILDHRVGPKLVSDYVEDLTPASEYLRVLRQKEEALAVPHREKGTGRPTKKERRQLEALND